MAFFRRTRATEETNTNIQHSQNHGDNDFLCSFFMFQYAVKTSSPVKMARAFPVQTFAMVWYIVPRTKTKKIVVSMI